MLKVMIFANVILLTLANFTYENDYRILTSLNVTKSVYEIHCILRKLESSILYDIQVIGRV